MLYVKDDGTIRLTRGDTARLEITIENSLDGTEYYFASTDALPQHAMSANPTEDMHIATKKYVDSKEFISSSTEGSTKKFKITVDDAGTITATEVT